jgi:hypothetical protein
VSARPLSITLLTIIFGVAMLGLLVGAVLPEHHRNTGMMAISRVPLRHALAPLGP